MRPVSVCPCVALDVHINVLSCVCARTSALPDTAEATASSQTCPASVLESPRSPWLFFLGNDIIKSGSGCAGYVCCYWKFIFNFNRKKKKTIAANIKVKSLLRITLIYLLCSLPPSPPTFSLSSTLAPSLFPKSLGFLQDKH